jgi:hypothetical protein
MVVNLEVKWAIVTATVMATTMATIMGTRPMRKILRHSLS